MRLLRSCSASTDGPTLMHILVAHSGLGALKTKHRMWGWKSVYVSVGVARGGARRGVNGDRFDWNTLNVYMEISDNKTNLKRKSRTKRGTIYLVVHRQGKGTPHTVTSTIVDTTA